MKKPNTHSRERHVRSNKLKLAKGRRRSYFKKKLKLSIKKQNSKIVTIRVNAPHIFYLNNNENRNSLLLFIREIENALLQKNTRIFINFSKTDTLRPCGTLYFRAHIEILFEKYPGRISCNYPKDEIVGQLFQHINILEKMGLTNKYNITADNVTGWHSVEGKKADTFKFEKLLHDYENELAKPMRLGLYDSMSEAVTNCAQHAYETLSINSEYQKWWMFASKVDEVLTVAIYDVGIGIAKSLRIKPEMKDIVKGLAFQTKRSDKLLLELAVGSNKSRTKLPYRGKGLPEMMEFVRTTNVGGLLIHSNRGTYRFDAESNSESVSDYIREITGTLIQWTLPLTELKSNE